MFKQKRIITFIIVIVGLIVVVGYYQFLKKEAKQEIINQGLAPEIDVSPDDKQIVFSYYKNGYASIYTANLDGSNVKKFLEMKDVSLLHPKFSTDGKKLLFLASPKGKEDKEQNLYVIDTDGQNKKKLTSTGELVTDAAFSPDSQTIFYIKAGVFKSYSSIATEKPHDYDLYSINSNGAEKKQITNNQEYGMFDLSVSNDGESLWFTRTNDAASEELLNTSLDGKDTLNKLLPKDKIGTPSISSVAFSTNNQQIVFSAVPSSSKNKNYEYELFSMDLATKQTEQLTNLKSYAYSPVYFHKENKIFFLSLKDHKNNSKFEIYTMDLDSKQINKIDLRIDN
ncbi:TolB family protein [Bacillus cereus]|uniref:TolB family protein n=1 Tax=Bacillus cereus TaxID=1396 RepID=UPI000C28BC2D|nr:DPP IV N-terminal domain-containing protein [Bacillus cereus]